MIEVENLTKYYGRTLAVDNITFYVGRGNVVGFLGPNGAGKTTTLRILTCFIPATSGSARVAGYDVFNQSIEVRKRIGYMPENVPLYPEMRVREYLMFRAALRGMKPKDRAKAVDRVAERCWLRKPQNVMNRRIDQISRGYRQRVGLADCLLHDPDVIILDEPTIGLDPGQVREMRNLIRELGQTHTIILSSHILAEVEQTCREIILISAGKIVAQGTPAELREKVTTPSRVIVEIKGAPVEQITQAISQIEAVREVSHNQQGDWIRLFVQGKGNADVRSDIAALAAARGWQLRELRREIGSLEDFFIQMTYEQVSK